MNRESVRFWVCYLGIVAIFATVLKVFFFACGVDVTVPQVLILSILGIVIFVIVAERVG